MAKKKRNYAPSGTWTPREIIMSRAFNELGGFAPQLLIHFLLKRDMDHKHNVKNKNSITMTYLELTNLFGEKEGITKNRVIRAIDELLAKGFIKIIRPGGNVQGDKTIYGLSEDWRWWTKGQVINERNSRVMLRGYCRPKIKVAA